METLLDIIDTNDNNNYYAILISYNDRYHYNVIF